MPDSSPRRGAPLGNHNALKHGYYSRLFPKAALKGLPPLDAGLDFSEEVQVLRLAIHRLLELSQDVQTFPEAVGLVRTLAVATSGLARLARVQHLLGVDKESEVALALREALADVVADLEAEEDPPLRPIPSFSPGN